MNKIPLINREKSILAFQERVLEQAKDRNNPLLERINFLSIVSSNLDEFFEVRLANIKERIFSGAKLIDGQPSKSWEEDIHKCVENILSEQYELYHNELYPRLEEEANVKILNCHDLTSVEYQWLEKYYLDHLKPLLTPIVLDVAHPFPHISNKTLNFVVELEGSDAFGRAVNMAILPISKNLPTLVRLPILENHSRFILLSDIISNFFGDIFKNITILGFYEFRLTRNSHLFIDKEELTNLHQMLQGELHQRNFGHAVRLEINGKCPQYLIHFLLSQFDLERIDLYLMPGMINFSRLRPLLEELIDNPSLFYKKFVAKIPIEWQETKDYFSLISQKDLFFHHPFDSFTPIVDLLTLAANDPLVRVIRMTVYRTGDDSILMKQLVLAAQNGKEVNVAFELMARFDEATNLSWATTLEEAGAKIVYGVFGLKTHAKMLLIVRDEENALGEEKVRYYTHLSTGNYHSGTAKQYTDMALITANEEIAKDVSDIFLSLGSPDAHPPLRCLWQAPFNFYGELEKAIDREIMHAKKGNKAYLVARMNALLEERIIVKLYEASKAGVRVDLIVRGACSLKPGIKDISDNIRVISIVGRFLEHTRIYYFYNAGKEDLYLASADWMNRNFFRRIEVATPIFDDNIKKQIVNEGIIMYLNDNMNAWALDGKKSAYYRIPADSELFSAQSELLKSR